MRENILAANVFLDFDEDFLIGEAADAGLSKRYLQVRADGLGQLPVGITRKYLHDIPPVFMPDGALIPRCTVIARG